MCAYAEENVESTSVNLRPTNSPVVFHHQDTKQGAGEEALFRASTTQTHWKEAKAGNVLTHQDGEKEGVIKREEELEKYLCVRARRQPQKTQKPVKIWDITAQ